MKVLQGGRFARRVKRLHKNEKQALDIAVRAICKNPEIGQAKIGDLAGILVYKYKLSTNQLLLAYKVDYEKQELILLAYGSHENFYRDLKNQ